MSLGSAGNVSAGGADATGTVNVTKQRNVLFIRFSLVRIILENSGHCYRRGKAFLVLTYILTQALSQKFAIGGRGLFWGSGGRAPSRRRLGVWGQSLQPPQAPGSGGGALNA